MSKSDKIEMKVPKTITAEELEKQLKNNEEITKKMKEE